MSEREIIQLIHTGFIRLLPAFLLITLVSTTIYCQTLLLRDTTTDLPIPNVLCQLNNQSFTISDSAGRINYYSTTDTLHLSHLGYVDTTLIRAAGEAFPTQVYLNKSTYTLPVFAVSARAKPRSYTPLQIVKAAMARRSTNYPAEREKSDAFYREVYGRPGEVPDVFNEAILGLDIGAYDDRHSHRKAWVEGWRRNTPYISRLPEGQHHARGVHYPEGTQIYPAVDDAYALYAVRYCTAPNQTRYPWFSAGPLGLLSLDKLRLGYDFLDKSLLRKYNYHLVDTVVIANELCYRVDFAPADDDPTHYHVLPKVHRTGVFRGSLFITLDNFALVRYTSVNDKFIVPNYGNASSGRLPPGATLVEVDFRKHPDNRWRISRVLSQVVDPTHPELTAERTLEVYPARLNLGYTPTNWVKFDYTTTLRSFIGPYSQTIWESFVYTPYYSESKLPPPNGCFERTTKVTQAETPPPPKDPAAASYLRTENAYYSSFFERHLAATRQVAEALSDAALGYRVDTASSVAQTPDTLLLNQDGILGFYRSGAEESTSLLYAVNKPLDGYRIIDYVFGGERNSSVILSENINYNRRLELYSPDGPVTTLDRVDDFIWVSDTLYASLQNELLRVDELRQWTQGTGWVTVLQETDPTYEYAFDQTADGDPLLISESLIGVETYRLRDGEWVTDLPRTTGRSPLGRGYRCAFDLPVAFVEDCRSDGAGEVVIASDSARHKLYARTKDEQALKRIPLPPPYRLARFSEERGMAVELEGTGTFGHHFTVDPVTATLRPHYVDAYSVAMQDLRDSLIWVTAADGTAIPCDLRWKESARHELRGTVLKVYAAYGSPYLIGHRPADVALMNLGFAVTYVHARGGGALGPDWYAAGRGLQKITACRDYLAAANYFHSSHPLKPGSPLFGMAQSAGGPVLGYAINEAPELFAAAIFDHAFLDVAGTMRQPKLPLTVYEYPEWGNPRKSGVKAAQLAYSPLQNVRQQAYPALLFLTGYYDKTTPYGQIAHFVAAVRKHNTGDQPVLFHTNLNGGHPGTAFGPGQSLLVEQLAFILAVQ